MGKSKVLLITMIILLLISSVNFAADEIETDYALEDYAEIINPTFGDKNEVIIRENLFISINLKTEKELFLTINKVEEQMDERYLEQVWTGELDRLTLANNITEYILRIQDIDVAESSSDETLALRDQIFLDVRNYIDDYLILNEYKKLLNDFSIENKVLLTEDTNRDAEALLEKYENLQRKYNAQVAAYQESKANYREYLKTSVFKRQLVESTGVVPYYEQYIEDVNSGKYEFILELKENDEFIELERFYFNIIKRQELNEEDIINEINSSMKLLRIQPQEE